MGSIWVHFSVKWTGFSFCFVLEKFFLRLGLVYHACLLFPRQPLSTINTGAAEKKTQENSKETNAVADGTPRFVDSAGHRRRFR